MLNDHEIILGITEEFYRKFKSLQHKSDLDEIELIVHSLQIYEYMLNEFYDGIKFYKYENETLIPVDFFKFEELSNDGNSPSPKLKLVKGARVNNET